MRRRTSWPLVCLLALTLLLNAVPNIRLPGAEAQVIPLSSGTAGLGDALHASLDYPGSSERGILELGSPEANVDLVSQFGGYTFDIAVSGSTLFFGVGYRLTALSVADPGQPIVVGESPMLPSLVRGVALSGNYAYVATSEAGLTVIQVSDPSSLTVAGSLDIADIALDVAVAGSYAYVSGTSGGLTVIDVSNPEQPQQVGLYDTPGSARRLAVADNYVYMADGYSGLVIIDVTAPDSPVQATIVDTPGYASDVTVTGHYAFLTDGQPGVRGGMRIFDVTTPETPTEVSSYGVDSRMYSGIDVSGSYAYLVGGWNGMDILDVSDPASPSVAGGLLFDPGGEEVVVAGSYAYVTMGSTHIIDVSSPGAPFHVSAYEPASVIDPVAVYGDYAYAAGTKLQILGVADPAAPSVVGVWDNHVDSVAIRGAYAYVGTCDYADCGLSVLSIADPAHPSEVGFCVTGQSPVDVAISGDYAYVAVFYGGLRIIDISDPQLPHEVSHFDTAGYAAGVAVAGNYAYVAEWPTPGGLRVVDISNPLAPTEAGFYDTPGTANDVAVAGEFAYVADGSGGLQIVDIADPSQPTQVGSYDTPGSAWGVAVQGRFVYVADYGTGLQVINVADPAHPAPAGSYDTPGQARSVAVAGNYVLLADSEGGLLILEFASVPSWTLMFFIPGDNDLDTMMTFEYASIVRSGANPDINVAAFYDSLTLEARYIAFMPEGVVGPDWKGELNTGDSSTLSDFVQWAKTTYPAQHYGLIISDHGHALGGTAYDEHPSDDHLTPSEVRQALQTGGWVDVLYMANCLMANLEMEYQLQGLAGYYVGSESISWGPLYHDSYSLAIGETTTPEQLAGSMAASYWEAWSGTEGRPSTISAVRLAGVADVAEAASGMAAAIRQHWTSVAISVWALTDASVLQRFDEDFDLAITNSDRLADLYHFAQLVADLPEADLQNAANALVSTLDDYIVYNHAWSGSVESETQTGFWNHGNANGVSIAIPRSRISFYTFDWLDLAEGADWTPVGDMRVSATDDGLQWGPLLVDLVNEFNPDAPDTPEPPEPLPPLVSIWQTYLPIVHRNSQ